MVKPWLLLCLLAAFKSGAQDTVKLGNVEVTARKQLLSQTGKKTEAVDSALKQQFKFSSVADVLSFNTPVFIKSYGPGAIATTAFRGGNASQTAVLWNGFNLQNAMLGQADLALMPSVLFEDVSVEYGGSSSLWGSGAVGGSIHLDNKSPFNKGLVTTTNLGGGSFGLLNGSAAILFSKQKFVSNTKLYEVHSQNNYLYRDTLNKANPLRRLQNAGYDFKGLMQEFKYLINPKQVVAFNAWLNANNRRLPAFNPLAASKMYQYDGAVRLSGHWSFIGTRFRSIARGAYFNDRIDYTDSLAATFSKSRVQTFMGENENYFRWRSNQQLNAGVNVSSSSAVASEYGGRRSMSRVSFLAGNRSVFFTGRLITYISVRAEYFSVGALPVTGNVSAEYLVSKHFTAKINAARVYRQPTLNDLYWVPGGNVHLKPEQGYTGEAELNYSREAGRFSFFISAAAYSRKIENWILWVPGANANPSPVNIQKVWSRGAETTWRLQYRNNQFKLGLNILTGYVLSTTDASAQENTATLDRQLIYTPRYTVNGNISIAYRRFNLLFLHQYLGYRFTSSDNLQWLPPYQVSSLRINYRVQVKKLGLMFFAACNNLFDVNYSIIAGRPMPLRNFEAGITIQTKNNK